MRRATTCATCRWQGDLPHWLRECRRYAPRPIVVPDAEPDLYPDARWPAVDDGDWCGEWAEDFRCEP